MTETEEARTVMVVPHNGLVRTTHLIYALHAFSIVMGIMGQAFIVTTFLTGWPSIIAVILNYVKRSEVRHTFLDSHFGWQIRTFWYAVLWVVISGLLIMTLIGIPVAWMLATGAGIWILYRIARGWMALNAGRPMPA